MTSPAAVEAVARAIEDFVSEFDDAVPFAQAAIAAYHAQLASEGMEVRPIVTARGEPRPDLLEERK